MVQQISGESKDIGTTCGEFTGAFLDSLCGGSDRDLRPCCASKRAVAKPIPRRLPAPVIRATLPEKSIDLSLAVDSTNSIEVRAISA
jgi:hypothetical protein